MRRPALVWLEDDRGYWANETWVHHDRVDCDTNGRLSMSTEQCCHVT